MKIGIIGSGWYGCHIGKVLKSMGIEIDIYEKSSEIFKHASGKNQNRLHQGFHYCRNYKTRNQTVEGYRNFMKHYPQLTKKIVKNLYAVPKNYSLIDFHTYYSIMISSGLLFDREFEFSNQLDNIEGVLNTNERLILVSKAKEFFMENLGESIQTNFRVDIKNIDKTNPIIKNKKYDYIIDCSWGHLINNKNIFFEPTILFYYKCLVEDHPALTFVDGELPSIYPSESNNKWTLSHVKYTPLGKCEYPHEAKQIINNLDTNFINKRRELMEDSIIYYYPKFKEFFQFNDIQLSIKTKPYGLSANRACEIKKDERLISIMSGKIDTIFTASNEIIHILGC